MTININKIFSICPNSMLTTIDEYNKTGNPVIGSDIPPHSKVIVDYEKNNWVVKRIDLLSLETLDFDRVCSQLVENAIDKKLESKKIFIVNKDHMNIVKATIKSIFGSEEKLKDVQFKLLMQVDESDLRTKEDVIAFLFEITSILNSVKPKEMLLEMFLGMACSIDLQEKLFDDSEVMEAVIESFLIMTKNSGVHIDSFICTMRDLIIEVDLKQSLFSDNMQTLVEIVKYMVSVSDFSKLRHEKKGSVQQVLHIINKLIEASAGDDRQILIETVINIAKVADFKECAFSYYFLGYELMNTLGIAIKYADNSNRKELFEIINKIVRIADFSVNPFNAPDLASTLLTNLKIMFTDAEPDQKRTLIKTINEMCENIDFGIRSFKHISVLQSLYSCLNMAFECADPDQFEGLIKIVEKMVCVMDFNKWPFCQGNDVAAKFLKTLEVAIEKVDGDFREPLLKTARDVILKIKANEKLLDGDVLLYYNHIKLIVDKFLAVKIIKYMIKMVAQ